MDIFNHYLVYLPSSVISHSGKEVLGGPWSHCVCLVTPTYYIDSWYVYGECIIMNLIINDRCKLVSYSSPEFCGRYQQSPM